MPPGPNSLDDAIDAIGDMIVRRDVDDRAVAVNAAFRRVFGGADADWAGRRFWLPSERSRGGYGDRVRFDTDMQTVAGPACIEWELTRLPDGGSVAVGRDVSARRAGEAALKDAREAAEAEARGRETLFASITHELRTPAAGAVGMANLLRGTGLTPEQRAYVDAIADSGGHLMALVDDVLDAANLEVGAFELREVDFELEAVVRGVIELVSPRARQRGLETAVFVDPASPRLVRGDPGRLRQILLNLLGNAVKFTVDGGVALVVERAPADGSAAAMMFRVQDTGPGVPEADRARIFEAFSRARSGATQAAEGAGLGLSIVRRLVDAMGGELGLAERPGGGSEFWAQMRFPIVEDRSVPSADLDGVSVVVASPAEPVRAAIARQIAAAGGRVRALPDIAKLGAALAETPSVALIDAAWARDGAAAVTAARVALVMMAPDQKAQWDEFSALGYGGWIVKPPRVGSLGAHLRAAWEGEFGEGPPAADAAVNSPTITSAPRAAVAQSRRGRVLLVEDNPVNRLMAASLLRRNGVDYEEAADGRQAVEAAARHAYDLILMDMRMPVMDGLDAARRIRDSGGPCADAPILALTANAGEADRRACMAAGMNDFLSKPLDENALRDALSRWTRTEDAAKLRER